MSRSLVLARLAFASLALATAGLLSACNDGPGRDDFRVVLRLTNSATTSPRVIKLDHYALTFAETPNYQYPASFSKVFPVSTGYDGRYTMRFGDLLSLYSSQPASDYLGAYHPDAYSKTIWNGVVPTQGTIELAFTYDNEPGYFTFNGAISGTSVKEEAVDESYQVDDSYCDPNAPTTKGGHDCPYVNISRRITLTVDVDVAGAHAE